MRVEFDMRKSVPENAKAYYEKSKKLKAKIPGLEKAIEETKRKLENLGQDEEEAPRLREKAERRWFEKFRWFMSSDGYLVIGGRDATTNEIIIKKHLEQNDLVFHADLQGAPFFIVKNEKGGEVPEPTRSQAASAAASYSKAWAAGAGSCDVYEVNPQQVSKSPPAGEYIPKGAFMVYGEKKWHKNVRLGVAVGVAEGGVIGGPVEAVAAQTKNYVRVEVGDVKQGELAKKVRAELGDVGLDDVQRFIPPGGGVIKK